MITELNTVCGKHERDWNLNVHTFDASAGIDLRPAETDYRHGVKAITITATNNEWVKILNGDAILIGPLNLEKGFPWRYDFGSEVYCDRGTALRLQTESDFGVHLLIEGVTGIPVASTSASASASASPSEGA